MKNILVTGGAGFIGSHTCKALSKAGFLPVTYDDLSRGHAASVRWGPLEEGNIGDGARLSEVLRRYEPLGVIHFAGFGYVGESMDNPALYYDNNVVRTASMLETFRHHGVRNIVFSSSCATYGGVHERRIDETMEQRPLSTYGFTKLIVERMLDDYARAYGFRSLALRYFNAAGADPEGEIGECHDPEPHFIPSVLGAAAGEGQVLELYGDDYPTPDGTCVRDYVHVHDLARGHVLAVQGLLDGLTGAVNLGTGRGSSLMEVIQVVRRITGRTVTTRIKPRREGDPAYAVADARKAAAVLKWTPMFTELDQIVGHAWNWMQRTRGEARRAIGQ